MMPDKIYLRKVPSSLTKVVIDLEKNIVNSTNDIGSPVILTVKRFKGMYEEGL